ncbi:MAG: response regulator [Deltaproteobacteria bacterium]|nr:response regulator [Deltaproteobacteria bacterium]
MKDIAGWIMGIEERAAKLYREAASALGGDVEMSALLATLARDEDSHLDGMRRAVPLMGGHAGAWSVVDLSAETMRAVEARFASCEGSIARGELTAGVMAEFIADTESSEWNDVFLFIVNTLKRGHKEFTPLAVGMQRHKRRIERFFEGRKAMKAQLERMKALQALWRESFLVVDDEPVIVDVLRAILENEGAVDEAHSGAEGLKKLKARYYAAIVSDVDMPGMNGLEFYEKAVAMYPGCKDRFLFFTGSMDGKRMEFFKRRNIRYLVKPANISSIREAVARIIGG